MMKIASALLVLLAVSTAQHTANPGAISASLNVTSIEHIMQTFFPLLSYYMVQNKTMDINYKQSGWFYDMDIKTVHVDKVKGWSPTGIDFEFKQDSDTLKFLLKGIDLDLVIDGTLTALYFIPFRTSAVNITNVTLEFELDVIPGDNNVIYELKEHSKIHIKNVKVNMDSDFLTWCIEQMQG